MRTPPYGIGRSREPPPLATSTPRHGRTPRPSPSPSLQEKGTRVLQSPARVRTSPPKGYVSSSRGSKAASPLRGRVPAAVTDRGAPRRRPRRSQGRRAPRSRNSHDANTSSQSVCHSTKPPVTFPLPLPLPRDDTVSDISIVSPMPALDVSYTAYLTPDVLTPTAIPPSPPTSRAPSAREIWDFDDEEAYVQHNPLYWLVPEAHEQPEPREALVASAPQYYHPHHYAPLPDTYIGHRPTHKPAPRWPSPYGRGHASPAPYLHHQEERRRGRGASPGTHAHTRLSPISENFHPTNIVTYADVHTQERPHRQPRGRSFKPSPPRRHRLAAQRKRSNIRIFDLKDDARFVYIVHALIQAFICIEQDLQSEIESHKDVLASLNATGQKLLGTLENQDEAVMLQRRLEEMNQRWNTLKHKSIAIRNRLEGNAENWNSLLLSLRELIEWVIRKDTELTALGPLVGDLNALAKFSDDLAAFRRVIDEKQPVIESNLKSGRQLIASEPPLSDTSDSEAGRELDGDARYRGDDNARDLTRAVRREVAKLSEKWAALRERAAAANAQADLACKVGDEAVRPYWGWCAHTL
ncbi:extensin-like isoform X3 [Penaeus japonicus]|uniref:extensin-like isoform X3 n=1 Tax=Penaeus japonicus TaxID=27405 RepID=UPI001C712E5A|nr:extensin-like isoform X3 [Penaeus japonicus]